MNNNCSTKKNVERIDLRAYAATEFFLIEMLDKEVGNAIRSYN